MSVFLRIFIYGCLILTAGAGRVCAQDQEEGVKKYGVVHNIAEDREVIKVGGQYEPEGLDKYMKRKFDQLFSQIESLEGKINNLTSQISELKQKIAAPGTASR